MARYTGPVCKLCRREGEKLFLKGSRCLTHKCSFERRGYPPGHHGSDRQFRRGRASNYLLQLREKQKARRIYGVYEKQFSNYFKKASKAKGLTGATLLTILESRMDNVVFRMGFAESRSAARQLVSHGHITLNGRRTNIPSALVSAGDELAVRSESKTKTYFKTLKEDFNTGSSPDWVQVDAGNLSGSVLFLPEREQIDLTINEQLIVEYYSR